VAERRSGLHSSFLLPYCYDRFRPGAAVRAARQLRSLLGRVGVLARGRRQMARSQDAVDKPSQSR
jgi:hypothetical protein